MTMAQWPPNTGDVHSLKRVFYRFVSEVANAGHSHMSKYLQRITNEVRS